VEHLKVVLNVCVPYKNFSQMKSPGITTSVGGKNKTLYIQTVKSIEEATKENLKKSLKGKYKTNVYIRT
jgi:hypothetical protein